MTGKAIRRWGTAAVVGLSAPLSALGGQGSEATAVRDSLTVAVIPQPVRVAVRPGRFRVTSGTVIWSDAASAPVARQLARYLEPATGFTFVVRTTGAPPANAITLRRDGSLRRLGDEGYALDVSGTRVALRAAQP